MTGTFFASAHSRGLRRHLMKDCDCETDLCLSAFVRVATSVQTIYSNLTELCHSAFVRVATSSSPLTMWTATFATAHSCGLRPIATNYAKSGKRFASAHSRGLRPIPVQQTRQRVSLPQRIRAGCDYIRIVEHDWDILCLSAFARVATPFDERLRLRDGPLPQRIRAGCDQCANNLQQPDGALPQRIRAGCDIKLTVDDVDCYLCHSAFVRVATHCYKLCKIGQTLCHSAFARVATPDLPLSGASGALCHSAFVRVATKLFILCAEQCFLCHSAFVRVATQP